MSKIGFIGLGKLGMPVAEVMARRHSVFGYDVRKIGSDTVEVVDRIQDAVVGMDLIFIAVPTPHDPMYDGSTPSSHLPTKDFGYEDVCNVLTLIAPHLQADQNLVLISTCLPGTTKRIFSKLVPKEVNFLYNPYFIAMGTVAHDFLNPEFMLIGTENGLDWEAQPLIDFYDSVLPAMPTVNIYRIMRWTEAECTKVFYNTFISFKLSFVNMIQDVVMKMGDMDVDNITDALSSATDRLISPAYMKAGMGDGGPCHPRDNIALSFMVEELGLGYDLFRAVMVSREMQAENMARYLGERCSDLGFFAKVVICGKSFKPGVPYTDGSYSVLVSHYLTKLGISTCFHDESVGVFEAEGTEPRVYLLAHIGNAWHDYDFNQGSIVVDPWRAIPESRSGRYKTVHYGRRCGD